MATNSKRLAKETFISWQEIKTIAESYGVKLDDDDMQFEFDEIFDRIHCMYEAMAENDRGLY